MPCLACEDLSPTRGVQQLKLRLECALSSCGGRIRKEDVLAAAERPAGRPAAAAAAPAEVQVSELRGTTVKMSRLRKVIDWTGPAAVGAMKSAGISYSPLTLENQPDLT